jgi:hypothetical protein
MAPELDARPDFTETNLLGVHHDLAAKNDRSS